MTYLRSRLRDALSAPRTVALGALSMAAVLFASVLVVQSTPRAEIDLNLSDGAVWLSSTTVGGLSLLDGGSGTIAASLGVAAPGDTYSVEQWGSDAIVVNRTDGTVSRLDGARWTITTGRVQFGEPNDPLAVVTAPAGGSSTGWIMTPGQAAPIDLETLQTRSPVPVAAPFEDGLVTTSGALLYASTDPALPVQMFPAGGGPAELIDALDGPTALIDLSTTVAAVDLDDRRVWLESDGVVCDQLEFPAGAKLHAGGDLDTLIVVSDLGGAFVWDPSETGCPTSDHFVNLGQGMYGNPTVAGGWAVVPEISEGAVVVIDLDDRSLTRTQNLLGVEPGTEVDLIAEDGAIWYNDPASSHAGLIRRNGTVLPVEKYQDGATGFTAAPVEDPENDESDISVAGVQQDRETDEAVDATPSDQAEQIQPTPDQQDNEEQTAQPESDERPVENQPEEETSPEDESPDEDDGSTENPDDNTGQKETPESPSPDENPDETPDEENGEETPEEETPEEETPVIQISIGVSATQAVVGETINFTAVTVHGQPNNWDQAVSSPSAVLQQIETFGSFRFLFTEAGRFTVTLTACDFEKNCDDASVQVEILDNPDFIALQAAINGPTSAKVGDQVDLLDASQGDPDSWSWDLDGGSPSTSTSQNVTVDWSTPGTKTVTLTVERSGESTSATHQVVVEELTTDPSPFGLSCSPTALDAGATSSCSLQGDAADFDDLTFTVDAEVASGVTTSEPEAGRLNVSYDRDGAVAVTLSGTDKGTSETVTDSLTLQFTEDVACIQALPNPTISGPTELTTGQAGSFTGDGEVCTSPTFTWSANGSAAISDTSGQTTSVSWPDAGTYTLTLWFDSGGSGSNTVTRTVTVTDPDVEVDPSAPEVAISGPSSLDENQDGNFTATNSGGPISTYSWTTSGGGGTGSNSAFTANWGNAGNYTVTLNVEGPGGTDSATYAVTVDAPAVEPSPFGLACSVATAPVDQIFSCDLVGSPANFSNPAWTVGPASAQSWRMSDWEMDAAGTDPGSTVTVTLSATDLATGLTVTASDSVQIDAAPEPEPSPFGLACSVATAPVDQIFSCDLVGSPANFSNPAWTVGPASAQSWRMSDWEMDAAGTDPGSTVTVTLSATDLATGLTVTASDSVQIDAAPEPEPPPTDPEIALSCSTSSATQNQTVTCSVTNAGEFTGLAISATGTDPAAVNSWGGPGGFSVEYTQPGPATITVSVSGTVAASGNPKGATFTISIS